MAFSYKPLWKLLIDREMTKKQLMQATGIAKSTMDKMARGEPVSMDTIDRICGVLECAVENVIEHLGKKFENEMRGNRHKADRRETI